MTQDKKFEIPQELRQLAEENVERARQLYVQFMEGVGQAMAAWSSDSMKSRSELSNSLMRTLMRPSSWRRTWRRLRTSRS